MSKQPVTEILTGIVAINHFLFSIEILGNSKINDMFPTFLVCLKIEKYQTIRCWLSCESTQVTKMFRWNSNVTRRTMNPSTVMLISWAFSPVDDSAAFLALVYLKIEISKKCKKNEENIIKNEKRKRKKIILLCHTMIKFAALLWPYEQ